MKFDKLEFNPSKNPAVLDTATWDCESAVKAIGRLPKEYLQRLCLAAETDKELPGCEELVPYQGSLSKKESTTVFLAGLKDGQQVFVELDSAGKAAVLGEAMTEVSLDDGNRFSFQKAIAENIDKYFRQVNPAKGPKALGDTPRLGIGVRMTTACWPAILKVMTQKKFKANMIQNSVRELNFMSTLLEAQPPETNYACGFGTIETGYTGSSFEGLLVSGVLEALKYPLAAEYGADADHLQIKRGPEGLARAKRFIDSCRYYSFYTMDMADILGYAALGEQSDSAARGYLEQKIPDSALRKEVISYHHQLGKVAGSQYGPDEAALGRFVGKHWDAMEVMEQLAEYIRKVKQGQSFDLEFTIDEHPPEVPAFDCLTSDEELIFVMQELKRRRLPVSHVAPNYGAEKGLDYRCPDGLEGLEKRLTSQFRIAEEFGMMLDFHSADDLTSGPRHVIRKATGGKHHYKISPMLQIIYAAVLRDFHPDLFQLWWEDAMGYASREATADSPFAQECIKAYEESEDKTPSHRHMFFHHYSFAFVGRRDKDGRFLHRDKFYDLSPGFYQEYENRLISYLGGLADELF